VLPSAPGAFGPLTAHLLGPTPPRPPGYPLQTYNVLTEDGYVLRMERIPRPGAPDVALFMHGGWAGWVDQGRGGGGAHCMGRGSEQRAAAAPCGFSPAPRPAGLSQTPAPPPALLATQGILDTSLTWVSSGVTGSQAFAAWDQGFDVWLGSSRSNPPRVATGAAPAALLRTPPGPWQLRLSGPGPATPWPLIKQRGQAARARAQMCNGDASLPPRHQPTPDLARPCPLHLRRARSPGHGLLGVHPE
jgi:hypothetical protein